MMPMLTSGCPIFALSEAIRRSQARASSAPPPRAKPLIAARIGLLHAAIASPSRRPRSEKERISRADSPTISLMSAPATKARSPAPVRMIAPTSAANRPTWSTGDFWVYSYSAAALNQTASGSLRLDVVGTESVTLNGTPYSAYKVQGTVSYEFGSLTTTFKGDLWYTTDLAIAEISFVITLSGSLTVTIWGNPPQHINWPLTSGDPWASSTDVTLKELAPNGTATSTYTKLSTTFSVLADTSVTVPAGTFTATPVKETMAGSTSYTINYWSPQAGNSVRNEAYNGGGSSPSGGYNLTDYKYQNGSFFTTVLIGLPLWIWLVLIVFIAAVVGVAVAMRRRRRRPAAPPPGWSPPQEPPMGPPP